MDNNIEHVGLDQRANPGTKRPSVDQSGRDVWDREEIEIVEATPHKEKENMGLVLARV